MRYCIVITILSLIFFINPFFGQHSEFGVFGGTSYYLGEINPGFQLVNKPQPVIGVLYRKNLNKRYSLRFGANYGKLTASDDMNSTALSSYRKLSFFTNIFEGYGIIEFNFIPYQINNYTTSNFTPYVFIGAAVFGVDPSIEGRGPESITSQGSKVSPAIPFGFGVKFNFAKNLGLGIEWGMRKTFTDGIDGLAQYSARQYQLSNSQNKDWYSFVGVTLNYKFLTKRDHCPGAIN